MAEKKYVTEVEEGDVQIIKRVHFRISRPRTEAVQDIVLDLLTDGRKELMKLMALEVCRQNLADGFETGMKALDGLEDEMRQVIRELKKELDDELPFH
jgi:hypothetical protein